MITNDQIETVEKIKQIIEPMTEVGEFDVDWEKVHMLDTLGRMVNNLRIANVSYCAASKEDIKNRYHTVQCAKCGWWGSSKLLNGGNQIADTGDHGDCTCPVCDSIEINDKESL